MSENQRAQLEATAQSFCEQYADEFVMQEARETLTTLLAAQRTAVLEEEGRYWDQAAEGPCKDGDDFAWANRLSARYHRLAQESRA